MSLDGLQIEKLRHSWKTNTLAPILGLFLKIVAIVLAFCIVSACLIGYSIWSGILYSIYQVVMVFASGLAISLLLRMKFRTNVEWCGISFIVGYVFNIVLYFVIVPTKIYSLIPGKAVFLIFAIITCIVIMVCSKKAEIICARDKKGELVCLSFVVVVLAVQFLLLSSNSIMPYRSNSGNFLHSDNLYWIGNCIELVKQFPPKNFRYYPQPYSYHYFSSMCVALPSVITGIKIVIIGCYLYYVQTVFTSVFALYILIKRFTDKINVIVPVMVVVLFSTGVELISYVLTTNNKYSVPIGYDFAFGVLLWLIYYILDYYETNRLNKKLIIGMCVLVLILTGTKGQVSVSCLILLFFICFMKMIKHEYLNALITICLVFLVFLSCILLFANPDGYMASTHGYTQSNPDTISSVLSETFSQMKSGVLERSALGSALDSLRSVYGDLNVFVEIIVEIGFLLFFQFFVNPIAVILIILGISHAVREHKRDAFGRSLLFTIIVLTLLSAYLSGFGVSGISVMYFIDQETLLAVLLFLEYRRDSGCPPWKLRIIAVLSCISFLYGSVVFRQQTDMQVDCMNNYDIMKHGLYVILLNRSCVYSGTDAMFFTKDDADCYMWLGTQELDDNLIFLFGTGNMYNSYIAGVISEQHILLDEEMVHEHQECRFLEEFTDIMRERKVKYLVFDKDIFEECDFGGSQIRIVYENNKKTVVQLF